jgi:hypothetical protein
VVELDRAARTDGGDVVVDVGPRHEAAGERAAAVIGDAGVAIVDEVRRAGGDGFRGAAA